MRFRYVFFAFIALCVLALWLDVERVIEMEQSGGLGVSPLREIKRGAA